MSKKTIDNMTMKELKQYSRDLQLKGRSKYTRKKDLLRFIKKSKIIDIASTKKLTDLELLRRKLGKNWRYEDKGNLNGYIYKDDIVAISTNKLMKERFLVRFDLLKKVKIDKNVYVSENGKEYIKLIKYNTIKYDTYYPLYHSKILTKLIKNGTIVVAMIGRKKDIASVLVIIGKKYTGIISPAFLDEEPKIKK